MDIFSKLVDGKAFILVGPPVSGESEFLYQYLQHNLNSSEPVIYVMTDTSPEEMKKDMIQKKIFVAKFETDKVLQYIDCYSKNAGDSLPEQPNIKRTSGPLALNELSIALSSIQSEIYSKNPKHRIIFQSLSTLLMYSNANAVARFIQVLISKIKKAGGGVLFTIEEGMHDSQTITTLEHLMDGIIEIKKEGAQTKVKARGIDGYEDWTELKF